MKSYLSLWDRICDGKIIYIPPAIVESGNISLNALERTGAVLNDKLFWAKIVHSISSAFVWFLFRVSTLLLARDEMMQKSVMDLFFVVRISKSLWNFVSICLLQSNLPPWAHEKSIWQVTHLTYVSPFVEAWRHFHNVEYSCLYRWQAFLFALTLASLVDVPLRLGMPPSKLSRVTMTGSSGRLLRPHFI